MDIHPSGINRVRYIWLEFRGIYRSRTHTHTRTPSHSFFFGLSLSNSGFCCCWFSVARVLVRICAFMVFAVVNFCPCYFFLSHSLVLFSSLPIHMNDQFGVQKFFRHDSPFFLLLAVFDFSHTVSYNSLSEYASSPYQ